MQVGFYAPREEIVLKIMKENTNATIIQIAVRLTEKVLNLLDD